MVNWKEKYAIGILAIDEQHKELFRLTNEVYALLNDELITDKYDQIIAVIEALREYTIEHFAAEEAYMFEKKYKKFFFHKTLHADFIDKINSIDITQIDNDQNLYIRKILNFVAEWLVNHILIEDKLLASLED